MIDYMAVIIIGFVQRLMVSHGCNLTFLHDDNFMIGDIGIEPMCDIDYCLSFELTFERLSDFLLCGGIYGTQRIIHDNDGRFLDQCSCNGSSLFLSTRKRYSSFSYTGLIFLGKLRDFIMDH